MEKFFENLQQFPYWTPVLVAIFSSISFILGKFFEKWLQSKKEIDADKRLHDKKIAEYFIDTLNPVYMDFFRNHDFKNSFSTNNIDGMSDFIFLMQGKAFLFNDKELEKIQKRLFTNISQFVFDFSRMTFPVTNTSNAVRPPEREWNDSYRKNVIVLNNSVKDILKDYDRIIPELKKKGLFSFPK